MPRVPTIADKHFERKLAPEQPMMTIQQDEQSNKQSTSKNPTKLLSMTCSKTMGSTMREMMVAFDFNKKLEKEKIDTTFGD